ncbi:MAG: tRNA (adenosine(37)-N6)-threonylcarbamoyltransferase complex ATPase subunit type 1 TsaE [Deltaproteobacteria bacterium]|nr:tRNA (adenosine(37)-N6)-threonylcarbamoyltransferase complex ATPase subunit type 1 TsaE [Deltaproteobacteria bacterium]
MPFDKTVTITSHTPRQTEEIGSLLGSMLAKGDIIALCGELGTGKTTLVRGMARGIGLEEGEVASPSFTLVNEYEGPLRLFHIDLYRLTDEKELIAIDYEEYLTADGVVVIEWADRLPQAIPADSLWITLRYLGTERREIVLRAEGDRYKMMIEELQRKVYTELSL